MSLDDITKPAKRWLRRHFGLWPILELRNKVLMGPALPRLIAFENREVARHAAVLGRTPTATVACIVPTYRRPEQLVVAVESILAQEYQDFIIVVVDDGGGLPALPEDERITAVSLSRNTAVLGLVRNVGIRLCSSKYLAFLDDDNTWLPQHLTLTTAALEAGSDMVYTAIRRRTPDGAEFDVLSQPFDRQTFADQSNYVDANSIVLRRESDSLFSRLPRRKSTQPKEDWEFAYRHTKGRRVEHIPVPTVEYLINFDSYYTSWII